MSPNFKKKYIKPIQHSIEYYIVKLLFFVFGFLSVPTISRIGEYLGLVGFRLLRFRRDVTIDNLQQAFPEKSIAEIRQIARQCFRNFGRAFLQFLALPHMSAADLRNYVDYSDGHTELNRILDKDQGGIVLTAHFGNWEWLTVAFGAYGYQGGAIVKTQKNKRVDSLINELRGKTGLETYPLGVAIRGVLKTLKQKKFIGIAADQDFKKKGSVWVQLFGRPVLTAQGPAFFLLKTRVPALYSFTYHQPGGKLKAKFVRLEYEHLITGDEEKDIQAISQAHTSLLEEQIRLQPDHWFWMHRRWKSTTRYQKSEE